jgi:hypothetical protein
MMAHAIAKVGFWLAQFTPRIKAYPVNYGDDPADGSCVVVDEGPFTVRLLMYHRVITYREPVGLQWPGLEPG